MKLNIAYPTTGQQKCIEIDDNNKLIPFFDKRISAEVPADSLGDEWKGYVLKVMGGNDKEGFPMMQGVLTNNRVRILFGKGMKCFRERRRGQRKRKSVRGCIVGSDLSVMHLVVSRKGPSGIEGLTDSVQPKMRGPKRASKIRKLFSLSKKDDVKKYVVRRQAGKTKKAPRIQRLVTKQRLQRKKQYLTERVKRVQATRAARVVYKDKLHRLKQEAARSKSVVSRGSSVKSPVVKPMDAPKPKAK